MILSRRTMFAGLAATIAAPAIIRTPGLLMPIKPVWDGPMTATEVLRMRFLGGQIDPPLLMDDEGLLDFSMRPGSINHLRDVILRPIIARHMSLTQRI